MLRTSAKAFSWNGHADGMAGKAFALHICNLGLVSQTPQVVSLECRPRNKSLGLDPIR